MKPDDEQLTSAMRRIAPETQDAPDLFERVAAGARRRRRVRSSATIVGGAMVVAAIAVVPALNLGSSTDGHQAQPFSAAGSDTDAGLAGDAPAQPAPQQPTSAVSLPPTAAPTPLPTDAKGCPTVDSLAPGADAEQQARAAAIAAIPQRYGADLAAKGFTVTKVYPAAGGQGFGIVADAICGKTLGDNSYVVELGFASDSESVGNGQLFLADFPGGWQVWFQYH